ncbi:MAG: class I SAM-dependent methyltransferase [Gammaproteobacteria bacterium]|nr:MAG: class I SAM-dependent methyltransferase [Gammaproteobacteria bacterium]
MNALTNLTRIASRSIRRLGDAAFRARLLDMHRALATMGGGTLRGYLGASRNLSRAIAADGMIHPDECLLLMRLASQVREGVIVEIGSYRGRSTIALAMGSSRGQAAPVYAIEPHENFTGVLGWRFGPDDKAAFQRNIAHSTLSRLIHLISDTSEAAAQSWSSQIGLLWIDGDHRYEAVKKDFELWSPFLHADGRIAFDDSTVEGLGPHTLIEEILCRGSFTTVQTVGKVTVLEPRRALVGPGASA